MNGGNVMAIIEIDENVLKKLVGDTIKEYDKQQKEKSKLKRDRRLRNTDLLLRNYDNLLSHVEYAVEDEKELDEIDPEEFLDSIGEEDYIMSNEEYEGIYINAIKRTRTRTKIILKHIETVLEFYKQKCLASYNPNERRRYEVMIRYYFQKKRIFDVADELNCSDKTVSRDKKKAIEELSVLFFGIDGIKFVV